MSREFLLGAVAYDPKVVTIWEGFRRWFAERCLPMDFVLYSNYERQVTAHLAGHIDVAWNSPLAWRQTLRAAERRGRTAKAIVMRDTDRDLTSVIVVRADSNIVSVADLRGKTVTVGAPDSPQATLLPLEHRAEARHVAFGLAHLRRHADHDPLLRERLARAVVARHASLKHTAGLSAEVFDALVILAAGEVTPGAIAWGYDLVSALVAEMDGARRGHLVRLGYSDAEAATMSALHTRYFMQGDAPGDQNHDVTPASTVSWLRAVGTSCIMASTGTLPAK